MFSYDDFDKMFGDAQEYIPNPTDINEADFDALDEEDAGSEDDLDELDCEGMPVFSDAFNGELGESTDILEDENGAGGPGGPGEGACEDLLFDTLPSFGTEESSLFPSGESFADFLGDV